MEELLAAIREQTALLKLLTAEKSSVDLDQIAASYQTKTTVFTSTGADPDQILKADSRRWCVKFFNLSVATTGFPPHPKPTGVASGGNSLVLSNEQYNFRDCPAWVTGEWFWSNSVGNKLLIFECLYLRG